MKAFVIKLKNFFELNTNESDNFNFSITKRKLLIPLYQREYKWTNEKIISLINDIQNRDKFLGNIILDEKKDCYEIVDGQQRITTCYLTLMCLYNYYFGHQSEQNSIEKLMKPYCNSFLLQNNSIGDYILHFNNRMQINIETKNDVYYQKGNYERAYNTINELINSMTIQASIKFRQKLLDCQILVLINNQHDLTRPVEQLFLDINEKAQLLEVEDIFKGHCFENYSDNYDDLRNTWVHLKKCSMEFTKFGYVNLSQYIYLYLLERDNSTLSENLTREGIHYLEGKTMDETGTILSEMIHYGNSIVDFYSNINKNDYRFTNICQNSYEYRNTNDHKMLKLMCKEMLEAKPQYQKLPLMYFIYTFYAHDELSRNISHIEFRKIITNLYIYTSLFVLSGGRKSKQVIDYSLRDALNADSFSISDVITATKNLRIKKVNEFSLLNNYKFENIAFIYSIIDNYSSNHNWLTDKYTYENDYTLEHFIIPDNKHRKVTWTDNNINFEITLPQSIMAKGKHSATNYLVMPQILNGQIEHQDIETKISTIKNWCIQHYSKIPTHFDFFFNQIEDMPEYIKLKNMKGTNIEHNIAEEAYISFLKAYFDENKQHLILSGLEQKFKDSFQNQ